jgi:hypothetical protein
LVFGEKHFTTRRVALIAFMVMLCLISTLYGQAVLKAADFGDDIKRFGQLSLFMVFTLLPSVDIKVNRWRIGRIFDAFYVYAIILLLLFFFYPDYYRLYMGLVYPESLESIDDNLYALRYSYFFTDPNALGYMTVMVFAAHAAFKDLKISSLQMVMVSFLVISTQSRGAMIALFLGLIYFAIRSPRVYFKRAVAVSLIVYAGSVALDANLVSLAVEVIETRARLEDEAGSSFGGGRYDKYLYFLSQISPVPFGSGYTLYRYGEVFRPHSDLIRIMLSYGYLALLVFSYLIWFRFKYSFAVYVPVCLAFLLNSFIDENRLMPLFLILATLLIKCERVTCAGKLESRSSCSGVG